MSLSLISFSFFSFSLLHSFLVRVLFLFVVHFALVVMSTYKGLEVKEVAESFRATEEARVAEDACEAAIEEHLRDLEEK